MITMTTNCVFCGRQAVAKNEQRFPVCVVHKKQEFPEMKCICGEIMFVKESKYGAFFLCSQCGPVSVKKALEVNDVDVSTQESGKIREMTIRSDEVDFI